MRPPTIRNKDLRRYSIMPIAAVNDQRINRTAALSVLAVYCSFTDELGRTFVSQARVAATLGISRQAVSRQVRKLFELGYMRWGKKQYADQKTSSIRVIYDPSVRSENAARSNLSAAEQMDLAEREHQLQASDTAATSDVDIDLVDNQVDNSNQVQHQRLRVGATSEVALTGVINDINKDTSYKSMEMCIEFQRAADEYGTPRFLNDRDHQVMAAWIRAGLTHKTWRTIVQDHVTICKATGRDLARGIGALSDAVEASLSAKRRRG